MISVLHDNWQTGMLISHGLTRKHQLCTTLHNHFIKITPGHNVINTLKTLNIILLYITCSMTESYSYLPGT
jgi:hypothetical protein